MGKPVCFSFLTAQKRGAMAERKAAEQRGFSLSQVKVMLITLVSTVFIFISFVCTGVALDYLPGWWGWKYASWLLQGPQGTLKCKGATKV